MQSILLWVTAPHFRILVILGYRSRSIHSTIIPRIYGTVFLLLLGLRSLMLQGKTTKVPWRSTDILWNMICGLISLPSSSIAAEAVPAFHVSSNSFAFRQSSLLFFRGSSSKELLFFKILDTVAFADSYSAINYSIGNPFQTTAILSDLYLFTSIDYVKVKFWLFLRNYIYYFSAYLKTYIPNCT